jgi:hypothetical protein
MANRPAAEYITEKRPNSCVPSTRAAIRIRRKFNATIKALSIRMRRIPNAAGSSHSLAIWWSIASRRQTRSAALGASAHIGSKPAQEIFHWLGVVIADSYS